MTPTLTLSGDFADPDLDSLCDELQDLREWAPGEPARVDLRRLRNLEPTTLAVLLASLRGLHRRQICNPLENFEPPPDEGPVKCLSRDALAGLLAEGSGHWQEEDSERPVILGCESFAGSAGIDRVTASLSQQLTIHTDWSAASLQSLGSMVFELTENVMQHSQAKGGITVLQIRPAEQRIVLAIADNGIGVRESLAGNPKYSEIDDDLTAIAEAMGAGATAEPGTGGGMGLFLARCLVRSNEGSFLLRSGEACREESETVSDSKDLPRLHGTLISVDVRTDRPLNYSEVESCLRLPAAMKAGAAITPDPQPVPPQSR